MTGGEYEKSLQPALPAMQHHHRAEVQGSKASFTVSLLVQQGAAPLTYNGEFTFEKNEIATKAANAFNSGFFNVSPGIEHFGIQNVNIVLYAGDQQHYLYLRRSK